MMMVVTKMVVVFVLLSFDVTTSLSTNNVIMNSGKNPIKPKPKLNKPKRESRSRLKRRNQQQRQHSSSSSSSDPPYITCSSSIELERAINMFIRPTDKVLEFGSQFSTVSLQILKSIDGVKHGGEVVFVDIEREEEED